MRAHAKISKIFNKYAVLHSFIARSTVIKLDMAKIKARCKIQPSNGFYTSSHKGSYYILASR